MQLLLLSLLAYFAGSIPFGKLMGWRYGIDIQKVGSGNIGFANAAKELGIKPALLVLAGDILKGFLPMLLASHYVSGSALLVLGGLTIAGHIFPVWLSFKGGKGIATGLGVVMVLDPLMALMLLGIHLLTLAIVGKWGPAAIAAAWSMPLMSLAVAPHHAAFYGVLALVITWAHRSNIAKFEVGSFKLFRSR
jgi:glycerol-3-phosphate acyltransferase PlsY